MADATVKIGGDISDFAKEVAKIPGMTAEEVRDMVTGLRRGLKAAEDAAKKSAKETSAALKKTADDAEKAAKKAAAEAEKAWDESFDGTSALAKRFTEQMGGAYSTIGGFAIEGAADVSKLLAPLGLSTAAVGGLGLAAAGAGVALLAATGAAAGLAYGAHALAEAAEASAASLKEAGREALIPPAAKEAIEDYTRSTRELSLAVDELTVKSGAGLAGALGYVAWEAENGVRALDANREAIGDVASAISLLSVGGQVAALTNLVVDPFVQGRVAIYEQIDALRELDQKTKEMSAKAAAGVGAAPWQGPLPENGGMSDEGKAAAKKAADDTAARVAKYAAAVERGNEAAAESALKARLEQSKFNGELFKLEQLGKNAAAASAEVGASIAAWNAQALGDLPKVKEEFESIRDAALETASTVAGSIADVFAQMADAQEDATQRILDANDRLFEKQAQINADMAAARKAEASATTASEKKKAANRIRDLQDDKKAVDEKIQNNQDEFEAKRKAAMRLFRGNQAATILQIAAQTALAAITALGPPLGPIAGGIVAGGIIASGAASAGMVAAQSPPEYPMGMLPRSSPDHTVEARIQPREAVLNGRGVDALGGRDGVRDVNNGRGAGAGMRIELHVNRRQIMEADGDGNVYTMDPRAGKGGGRRRR